MNEDINFEDAMKQLESIANELEKGNLTLDESVKKFVMKIVYNIFRICTEKKEDY